ncbi:MAG: hypothetical protein CMH82_07615 [Nocardioides sp.]|nr:hypothetical protein [Nocardioides sp.]
MAAGGDVTTRIVVVEDHPLYRDAVVSLVRGLPGFEVVGSHPDAESALSAAAEERPDVVVLDLALPGMDGDTALSWFQSMESSPSVLVLTMSEDPPVLAAAPRAGARGYVVKGAEPDDIARALEGVARGQVVFGQQVATAVLSQASGRAPQGPAAAFPGLTTREVDVLSLLAQGRSSADIAAALSSVPRPPATTSRASSESWVSQPGPRRSPVLGMLASERNDHAPRQAGRTGGPRGTQRPARLHQRAATTPERSTHTVGRPASSPPRAAAAKSHSTPCAAARSNWSTAPSRTRSKRTLGIEIDSPATTSPTGSRTPTPTAVTPRSDRSWLTAKPALRTRASSSRSAGRSTESAAAPVA